MVIREIVSTKREMNSDIQLMKMPELMSMKSVETKRSKNHTISKTCPGPLQTEMMKTQMIQLRLKLQNSRGERKKEISYNHCLPFVDHIKG